MNYLMRKWSQVQNDRKNAVTIDTSELTINVLNYKVPISSKNNSTENGFMIFLTWHYGLSWRTTHPPCFPSRNITKNSVTRLPPMREVIIEQSLLKK